VDNVTVEFTKKVSTETPPRVGVKTASEGHTRGISTQAGIPKPAAKYPPAKRLPPSGPLPPSEAENEYDVPAAMDDLPPEPEMPPWEQEWQGINPPVETPTDILESDDQIDDDDPGHITTTIDPSIQAESVDQELSAEQAGTEKLTPPLILPDWDELAVTDEEDPDILHLRIPTLPGFPHLEPVLPLLDERASLPLVARTLPDNDSTPQEPPVSGQPTPVVVNPPTRRPASTETVSDRPLGLPPYLVSPTPLREQEGEIRMVQWCCASSGDKHVMSCDCVVFTAS
jgi:hypothetical protein